jgi:hypothetical protein
MFNIAATRILLTGSHTIYNPAAQQAAATVYLNTHLPHQIETFLYPPQAAWILLPLANLNAYVGFAIFLTVSMVGVALACWLLYSRVLTADQPRFTRAVVVIACVCTVPASWGLWYGEWDPLLLLPAVAAVLLADKKRSFAAGLVLSLLFLRPVLVWMVPVVLLGSRQWRMVAGMAVGGLVWLATAPLILGSDHLMDWPAAVHANWDATLFSLSVPGMLSSLLQSQSVSFWTAVVVGAACVVLAWRYGGRLADQGSTAIAIGLAASLAATPYAFRYDLILLAVPLCIWARRQPIAAIATAVFMSAIELVNERLVLYDKNLEVLALVAVLMGLAIMVRRGDLSLQNRFGHL